MKKILLALGVLTVSCAGFYGLADAAQTMIGTTTLKSGQTLTVTCSGTKLRITRISATASRERCWGPAATATRTPPTSAITRPPTTATTATPTTATTATPTTQPSGGQQCVSLPNTYDLPKGTAYPSTPSISESDGVNLYVSPDDWSGSAIPYESQTTCATGPSNWNVTYTGDSTNDNFCGTCVNAYPNVDVGEEDSMTTIGQLSTLSSTFSSTDPPSNGVWEEAYDIWLSNNEEVMIWVNTTPQRLATNGAQVCNTNAVVDGQSYTYQVWPAPGVTCANPYQTSPANEVGPNSVDMVLNTNETSGTINIKDVLNWLEANDAQVPSTATIGEIDFGWELCSTVGTQTFAVNGYTLTQTPE